MFDWTICLALDKRVKIRTIDHKLREVGWPIDLYTCGNGKLFPSSYYNHIDKDWGDRSQLMNHTACLKEITQIAKNRQLDNFFFLEDDAEINKRYEKNFLWQTATIWSEFCKLNLKWDLLYFAAEFYGSNKYRAKSAPDESWHIIKVDSCWSLVATLINKSAFDYILNINQDGKEGSDGLLVRDFCKMNVFCIAPNIFTSYTNYSFNEKKYLNRSQTQYL